MNLFPLRRVSLIAGLIMSAALFSHTSQAADPLSLQGILDAQKGNSLLTSLCQRDDPKAQADCLKGANTPSQSQYYSSDTSHLGSAQLQGDANLTRQGQAALKAQGFEAQAKARHDKIAELKADGSIPSLSTLETQYGDYVKHADVVAGGVNDKYHDCTGGVTYRYSKVNQSCIVPTHRPITCTLTRVRIKDQLQTGTVTVHPHTTQTGARAGEFYAFTMPVSNAVITQVKVHLPTPLQAFFGDRVWLSLQHQSLGVMTTDGYYRHIRAIGTRDYTFSPNLSLSNANVTFGLSSGGGSRFTIGRSLHPTLTITYRHAVPVMGWHHDCNEAPLTKAQCTATAPVCTQGTGTRSVANGMGATSRISQSCWQQTQTWTCPVTDTCAALPHTSVDEAHQKVGTVNCVPQSQTCQTQIAGVCIANRVNQTCTTKVEESTDLVCSQPNALTDCTRYPNEPWCKTQTHRSPHDMAHALTSLAIQNAMTCGADPNDKKNPPECKLGGFDPKTMRFFGGESKSCGIGALGAFNCCSDSDGWAGQIGAHQCNTEEREIAAAKQKHIVIKLGEFCAEKILGACIRKKEAYCVYPSKMARISITAARSQIGKSLGSPEHPNCEGLRKEEFAKLDFEHIDFSEIIGDIKPPTLPNVNALHAKFSAMKSDNLNPTTTNTGDGKLTGTQLTQRYHDLDPQTLREQGLVVETSHGVEPDEDAIRARYQQMGTP
ncbi:conjugal transfer protein TraN [Vibrio mediterranei]|uniref:conjugal transfer protein TraN n=1 Tax=Vibrio mediterranei TaxID=689 RepID=UPI001EFDFA87|nr:conjugal transfer protein TraN [Vibrio mediterranei]MCG9658771.1 conjugal transfer protein TraN [Vibrio mediterranei]